MAVTTGILRRVGLSSAPDRAKQNTLIALNSLLFFGGIILLEIRHQRRLSAFVPLSSKQLPEMSLEEFNLRHQNGELLIVIDNLILKCDNFVH